MKNRAVLERVLDSVADGSSDVDWAAVQSQVDAASTKSLINELRILAMVSELHRNAAGDADDLAPQARLLAQTIPPDVLNRTDDHASAETSTGETEWGHLRLLGPIGKGSYGVVYRAIDTHLQREVAVKLLHSYTPAARSVDRLLDEARTLARVSHPNVVAIHGAEVRDGQVGLWMEYVKGKTLETLLIEQGPFGEREAVNIGQALCRALAAVHGAGVVHRDVKAQNVMRAEGGRVVLMDFGAGEIQTPHTERQRRRQGTPLYLAPEVLAGQEASVQSDLYSLGVLLYHLVTRKYPVSAQSLPELVEAHRNGNRVPLHDVRADLGDAFVGTVERALQTDPAKRFSSAGAMLAALRSELTADTTAGLPPGHAAPWLNWRWLGTAAVIVTLAALLGSRWIVTRGGPATTPTTASSMAVVVDRDSADQAGVLGPGFADGLVTALANIEGLNVAQWTTSSRFSDLPPVRAASTLRVDFIVRVRLDEPRRDASGKNRVLRIHTQLLRNGVDEAGTEITTTTVDQFPKAQAALARTLATRIGVPITQRDEQRLERGARQVNAEAYIQFVQGLQRSHRRDKASLQAAVTHYERAIRIDPEFASPHAALSEAYTLLRGNFGAYPAQLAINAAVGSAMRSIELDDTLVYGWVALGFARFYLEWNLPAAERAYVRALELNPADAMAHHHYGNYLSCRGRHEEGLQQRLLARERDPNSLIFTRGIAWNYFFMRRYADAARELEAIRAVEPDNVSVTSLLGRTYVMLGRFDEGIAMLERNVETQGFTDNVEKLAFALAAAGRQSETRALLARISASPSQIYIKPYDIAVVYVALGEHETALDLLQRAYDERDGTLLLMKVDPRLDAVREHPRFGQLVALLGL